MNLLFLLHFVSFLLSPWLSLPLAHFYVLLCQLSISVLLLTPRCVCRQAELWHAGLHSQSPSIPQPPVLFSLLCKNHSPQLYQTLGCITQTHSNSCHSFLEMSKAGIVPVRSHQQTDKENRPALSTRVNIDSGCCWRAPFLTSRSPVEATRVCLSVQRRDLFCNIHPGAPLSQHVSPVPRSVQFPLLSWRRQVCFASLILLFWHPGKSSTKASCATRLPEARGN